MRSPLSAMLVVAAGLVAGACTDARSPALTQPAEPSYSVSSSVTVTELKADLDALLREPAKTAARYKVAEVESDLRLGRSTAYRNAWFLTAIPVVEWKLKRIPPEKQELFLKVLCRIWTVFGERLVERGFPAVDLCKFTSETLKNSTMQVVFNDRDNAVVVADGNYAAFVRAGSLKDPVTGQSVAAALYTALDIADQSARECPFQTNLDCYGNVFDRFTQPLVRFDPPSTSVRCAADPHTDHPTAVPTAAVEARVIGYAYNPATREFEFQPRDSRNDFGSGGAPGTCDNEDHLAIGPLGWDRDGLRNAFAWLGHSAARAVRLFTPTTAYALNVPWHIVDDGIVGLFAGDQVGMVDPVVRVASATVAPQTPTVSAGGTVQMSRTLLDKLAGEITAPNTLQQTTWSSSNPLVATVNSNGVVTGVAAGTALIRATVGTGEGVTPTGVTRTVFAETEVTVTPAPTPGADVVVFNDINVFDDNAGADANNRKLFVNLVDYTTTGVRAAAKGVLWYEGNGALNGAFTGETMPAELAAAGYNFESGVADLTSVPATYKVVFLPKPSVVFTADQINGLKQFASEGGRVIFVGEHAGTYGAYFALENQFLADMGAQMANAGGQYDCGYTPLPATSLRTHNITNGLTGVTVACASAISPGPNDYVFLYNSSNTVALAGVAKVSLTPLQILTTATSSTSSGSLSSIQPSSASPLRATSRRASLKTLEADAGRGPVRKMRSRTR